MHTGVTALLICKGKVVSPVAHAAISKGTMLTDHAARTLYSCILTLFTVLILLSF